MVGRWGKEKCGLAEGEQILPKSRVESWISAHSLHIFWGLQKGETDILYIFMKCIQWTYNWRWWGTIISGHVLSCFSSKLLDESIPNSSNNGMLYLGLLGFLNSSKVYYSKQNAIFQQLYLYLSAFEQLGSQLHEIFKNLLHIFLWSWKSWSTRHNACS